MDVFNYCPYITQLDDKCYLNVPQSFIFQYPLPPTSSPIFLEYKKFGSFQFFRKFLQDALGIATRDASRIAKFIWNSAEDKFKIFFADYAEKVKRAVEAVKAQVAHVYRFKPYNGSKIPKKQKKSRQIEFPNHNQINQEQSTPYEQYLRDFEFHFMH
ncbi:20449_t:CDS:1 [Funneliformis geosporum]|uniref:17063_t:CDS:1 n=1 Tax=Funneliformis geosporum TaxID=1117311 RepID=A0A9W4WXH2_9GLOM|nr:20449_t:CDS:1 [Funneliformis geosporum]CAI2170863.1 17063_t:CDS:1 [Funneliformis geosporum]